MLPVKHLSIFASIYSASIVTTDGQGTAWLDLIHGFCALEMPKRPQQTIVTEADHQIQQAHSLRSKAGKRMIVLRIFFTWARIVRSPPQTISTGRDCFTLIGNSQ